MDQVELFDIAPPQDKVGTQILDPTMPSNLDFQQPQSGKKAELKQQTNMPLPIQPVQGSQAPIRSYTLKGHVQFQQPPQYPVDSVAPLDTPTFQVRDLSQDHRSRGLWGLWESLVGYAKRQMIVDEGYVYLLARERNGLRSIAFWRIVDLFKVFVDPEEARLRLVIQAKRGGPLEMRDFQSNQLGNIVARLRDKANSLGLALVG